MSIFLIFKLLFIIKAHLLYLFFFIYFFNIIDTKVYKRHKKHIFNQISPPRQPTVGFNNSSFSLLVVTIFKMGVICYSNIQHSKYTIYILNILGLKGKVFNNIRYVEVGGYIYTYSNVRDIENDFFCIWGGSFFVGLAWIFCRFCACVYGCVYGCVACAYAYTLEF